VQGLEVDARALERALVADIGADAEPRLRDPLRDRERPLELAERERPQGEQAAGCDGRLVLVVGVGVLVLLAAAAVLFVAAAAVFVAAALFLVVLGVRARAMPRCVPDTYCQRCNEPELAGKRRKHPHLGRMLPQNPRRLEGLESDTSVRSRGDGRARRGAVRAERRSGPGGSRRVPAGPGRSPGAERRGRNAGGPADASPPGTIIKSL
jgi:hypothetical protein